MKIQFYRTGTLTDAFETYYVIQEKTWRRWKTICYTKLKDRIQEVKANIEKQGGVFL